jgi:hypothetical protein
MFFFEKKNQKTFASSRCVLGTSPRQPLEAPILHVPQLSREIEPRRHQVHEGVTKRQKANMTKRAKAPVFALSSS